MRELPSHIHLAKIQLKNRKQVKSHEFLPNIKQFIINV